MKSKSNFARWLLVSAATHHDCDDDNVLYVVFVGLPRVEIRLPPASLLEVKVVTTMQFCSFAHEDWGLYFGSLPPCYMYLPDKKLNLSVL